MALRRGMLREHAGLLEFVVRVFDVAMLAASGWLAFWIRSPETAGPPVLYGAAILVGVLIAALVLPGFGIYQSWRGQSLLGLFARLAAAWGSVLFTLLSILFLAGVAEIYSRLWVGLWALFGLLALILGRAALFTLLRYLRRHGFNHRRVLLVGAGHLGLELVRRVREEGWSGYDVIAALDDDPAKHHSLLGGIVPVVGSIDRLAEEVESRKDVDEVWLALPLRAEARVREALDLLRHSTVNIRFVPDFFSFRLLNHRVSEVVGFPMLDISTTPMTGLNRLIKAVEDRGLALLMLFFFSPLMVLIAIGVRLSGPGPILFKQTRLGWDGREIKIYKFRTMIPHTEPAGQVTQARPNDPRLTKFGAFLRRTSLDELPQLFNVLQGRMSIVGPRPHALPHNEFYKDRIDSYMLRHKVKPGITGWAQVNGYRGETDTIEKMRKRIEYDLYYIEHWSLWFDLKIIFLTVFRGFFHKNAY